MFGITSFLLLRKRRSKKIADARSFRKKRKATKTAEARSDFKELSKRKMEVTAHSACGAGGRIEPGVERSGTPGGWRNHTSSPRSGRQLFVIRHFMIIEIGPIAAARFAGWDDKPLTYLGFRCDP